MDNRELLVVAMAEKCRNYIRDLAEDDAALPPPLGRAHLKRMCESIVENAEHWPASRLHRWIGFIQCALIANGALTLEEAKRMFDEAKVAHAYHDEDLVDHLDPTKPFRLEIGGEA